MWTPRVVIVALLSLMIGCSQSKKGDTEQSAGTAVADRDFDKTPAVRAARARLVKDGKLLGPHHPDVAVSLNDLALLYDEQALYEQAEPLYKRALAIWEKSLGPDHPDVATSLNNLGGALPGNEPGQRGGEVERTSSSDRGEVGGAIVRRWQAELTDCP